MGALSEWKRLEISTAAAVAWLGSLEQVVSRVATPDFVWSGPKVPGLYSRDTRQVYEELMSIARQSIWASTYAYFDGPRAFETLARRMDAVPELRGDAASQYRTREGRHNSRRPSRSSVRRPLLGRRLAGLFAPTSLLRSPLRCTGRPHQCTLHAKAVIADEETVFITSANLTEAALDRNIETGLLLRDQTIAATSLSYFQGLIDRGRLRVLPAT